MKNYNLLFLLLLLYTSISTGNTLAHGEIRFVGKLVKSTCNIDLNHTMCGKPLLERSTPPKDKLDSKESATSQYNKFDILSKKQLDETRTVVNILYL
jgi:hypothetical protein